MGWKEFFKPRGNRFIKLLEGQAAKTVEGLENLEAYMRDNSRENAEEVHRTEEEADELRRILIDELNRTFVTPIDREDIFSLSRTIDDILDYADTTVDEMYVLGVQPNKYLREMASLLREAGMEIDAAIQRLEQHPNVAAEHANRAKALENRVERIYRRAIADLFSGPADIEHVMYMLKVRELYRHLSNAADRGDETANVISDIIVKMT